MSARGSDAWSSAAASVDAVATASNPVTKNRPLDRLSLFIDLLPHVGPHLRSADVNPHKRENHRDRYCGTQRADPPGHTVSDRFGDAMAQQHGAEPAASVCDH